LVARHQARSRAEAKRAVAEGRVTVDGVTARRSSTRVGSSSILSVDEAEVRYVSRGGHKLDHAIDEFAVEIAGRRCLDAGASTGGFTDCLLRRGAEQVVALDVGSGQLAPQLSSDPRVVALDRSNLRQADPVALGGPFDLIVADLSFISLCVVASVLASLSGAGTELVLLVKPQFELSRGALGKDGVVRRPELWGEAVGKVIDCLDAAGLGAVAVTASPLRGERGNREFFVHARRGPASLAPEETEAVLEEASR
jgi:23S rRNA (cytidine1920-2'-O)/16S rRNA (cytidine1409-2'-O)-methyltransferase